MIAARNLAKAWLLLVGFCLVLAAIGWALNGYRVASIFLFCGLLTAGGRIYHDTHYAPMLQLQDAVREIAGAA